MAKHDAYAEGSVPGLNEMQEYIGRETVEAHQLGFIGRRAMVKKLLLVCGGMAGATALLQACGDDDPAGTLGDAGATADAGAAAPDAAGSADGAAGDARAAALSVPESDPAVQGSPVKFPSGAFEITGYLARPSAPGTYPAVIVIHENRGLTDHIRDVARRLAKANFVALAPDLVSRGGGTEKVGDGVPMWLSMMVTPADLLADLGAGLDFLGKQAGVSPTDKFGAVGFCFGGGYTLRLAATNPKVVAAVPYYGPAPTPIEMLKATNAAILAHYAETDDNVNRTRDAVEMVLKEAGKTFEKQIHPGTGHAFNNDTGMRYNEAEAVAAWKQTLAWFETHLRKR